MKKLFILLLLLAGAHQAFGMRRVKSHICKQLDAGNLEKALKTYTMHKGMFSHFSFTKKEQANLRTKSVQEVQAIRKKIVDDSLNPLRTNFLWLLPTSATLLATTQEPILLGLGVLGTTLGSFGFKKQCDYVANSIIYQQLCAKANAIEKIFASKESELKTK